VADDRARLDAHHAGDRRSSTCPGSCRKLPDIPMPQALRPALAPDARRAAPSCMRRSRGAPTIMAASRAGEHTAAMLQFPPWDALCHHNVRLVR
jgi:hypothetical protein